MRKTLRTSMLFIVLTCSVYGGEIPNMVTGNPPPPPPTNSAQATQIVLNVLESLLSIF